MPGGMRSGTVSGAPRDATITQAYEGTNQIQRVVMARHCRFQFGAVTVDWTLSTRETDLPSGTRGGAARSIAVDGDIICDFSDYSQLHSALYQEIVAGRGH